MVYVPPRLFSSDIADSLRLRQNDGVAAYRMAFGGVVYVGEGRCIDTERRSVAAVSCHVVSANFLSFSRELMLHALLTGRRLTRECRQDLLDAITSALNVNRREQLARRFLRAVDQFGETFTPGTKKILAMVFHAQQRNDSGVERDIISQP